MKVVVVSAANSTNTAAVPAITVPPAVKTEPVSDVAASVSFSAPSAVAPICSTSGGEVGATVKRPASLDLNKTAKKPRLIGASPLIIDSPDLQNMKALNTPDLEKILLNSNLLQTPQPGLVFPSKAGQITTEQEEFGKGFEEALHSLHTSNNSQVQLNTSGGSNSSANTAVTAASNTTITSTTVGTGMSGGSFTYTNLDKGALPVSIKDEPPNPPNSPPVSPIDMETQEKIKLERKRQRNRVAASKCRKRKLERISKLEDKVKLLKGENGDLAQVVKKLKDHVAQLKQQVIEHVQSGCSIPTVQYNGSMPLSSK